MAGKARWTSWFGCLRRSKKDANDRGWRFALAAILFGFGLVKEVDHVVFPDGGLGVGAVAAGGVGDGEEDEAGVGHLVDEVLGDA